MKTLNFDKVEGDVHVGFNTLFAELIKEGAPYTLSLANRLYGEQSCEFLEVRQGASHRQLSHCLYSVTSYCPNMNSFHKGSVNLQSYCHRLWPLTLP